jgi:hypothetical protein
VERGHDSCRTEVGSGREQNRDKEGHGSTGRELNYHRKESHKPNHHRKYPQGAETPQ